VVVNSGVGARHLGVEALVEDTNLAPVQVESLDVFVTDTGAHSGLLKSSNDGTHCSLGSGSGHAYQQTSSLQLRSWRMEERSKLTVNGDIDDIGSSGGAREHGSSRDTGGVVRVNVDGVIGELLSEGPDETRKRKSQQERYESATRLNTYIVAD
jgi:hypothetical protein